MINLPTRMRKNSGFTLIELLVVIGILVVLLAIVLVAINPGRQFGQANNTKRRSDVNAVLNAIGAYSADKKGTLPGTIPVGVPVVNPTNGVDVKTLCVPIMPNYISAIPIDPSVGTPDTITDCSVSPLPDTKYTVTQDSSSRVTVKATVTDNSETISVTR